MQNFSQPGETLALTAPNGGVVSGTPYKIGSLIVIAAVDAAQDVAFSGHVTGVFTVPKVTGGGSAWTEGVKLYWDNSAKKFTKTSSANTLAGVAVEAAADGAATGLIRLDGVAR